MSFFNKVKGAFNASRDELTKQVGRFKNKREAEDDRFSARLRRVESVRYL